jgi:hypothetical protein
MPSEKLLNRISTKFQQLSRYYTYTENKPKLYPNSKIAVVNLGRFLLNKDRGRYSFILCQILKFSGFEVVVKLDTRFFFRETPYKEMLLAQNFTRVRGSSVKSGFIELHGGAVKKKSIKLLYGYGLLQNKIDAYYLPYTLHPRFYQKYTENTCFKVFRGKARTSRIIFAGNFERSLYDGSVLKEDFKGTISRVEVLDFIKAKYADNPRIINCQTKEHLYDSLKSRPTVKSFIMSEVKTPEDDWLSILSKCDFYLCLPGVRMPWSHNAFETMAVGTIPILQYNNLFYPPLVHLQNCIAFDSFETLGEAIQIALDMKEEDVVLMKQQVVEYYETYLNTERTIKKIQTFLTSTEETMTIAIPFLNGD